MGGLLSDLYCSLPLGDTTKAIFTLPPHSTSAHLYEDFWYVMVSVTIP
jgi:hypothetical protein